MSANAAIRLRILHTNDIHSRFEHMAAIAAIIKRLRTEAGEDCTLTLDIGDHMDRVRPETEGTMGHANVAVLNATGYDAVTIGNNEGLTLTAEALADAYREAAFAIVLANMPQSASGNHAPWAKPWHIVEKAGVRFGLIGVTACFPEFYSLLGWDVQEPMEVLRRLVPELRSRVDVIVVLSHLGLRYDERLAAEVPGIDIVLGGHTHHLLEQPIRIGGAAVCAAGKFGQYVGMVDLEWDARLRTLRKVEATVIPVPEMPRDERVAMLIEQASAAAAARLGQVVARLPIDMPVDWYGESKLGNLLAAGLRTFTEAEIGLVNSGQLLHGLSQGPLTAGMLLELCPSPINPCRVMLTGAQLLLALEQSLLPEFMDKPLFGFGFRGKVLGCLCVDGMDIEYDPQAEPYRKIRNVAVGGRPLLSEQLYAVGMIDMFTFKIGYESLSEGTEVQFFLPEFIRDVLLRELLDQKALLASGRKRFVKLL
ncbi:bifunctional metallophosphatase/5'-nucleotidase [Paenibacillus allorhizosphaerae]|uniref:Mannosylglucosyl-3-phosphoglycerate phosphatase n=1 Tax=Paenibacillus allorhizosphaerae TaxID=2849866 RepID=A0ABM8VEI1_9BACL|nr:5'-nucleotidase C-terminal domain-containing protein [Paenibacillus allorhizosphaerae]CAG7631301.1 Mannosylglucosyl-3-phosphoglycerate phosphatase [Paenibacillus allorhizosphaerae]